MGAVQLNFGKHIPEEKLWAQSYFESFAEKVAMGTLNSEPLDTVVSAWEEEKQDRFRPEPIMQYRRCHPRGGA